MPVSFPELLLVFGLGFLGSFGHCVGMCGPLAIAFSLSGQRDPTQPAPLTFHLLLNLGRLISYGLVGLFIGGVGSVLVASGQFAGVGSQLRQSISILTGTLLIWLGLVQIAPNFLPRLPLLNAGLGQRLTHQFQSAIANLPPTFAGVMPLCVGLGWGVIPCGFLYSAQLTAASTSNGLAGALTMVSFGLGTFPSMVGVGFLSMHLSRDRKSQLFRLGGWLTLIIGVLTLLRSGEGHSDYTGYGSLVALILALVARPLHRLYPALLSYRRAFGVGAFMLAFVHVLAIVAHSWSWNLQAFNFLLAQHQQGIKSGAFALLLMLPLTLTSFNRAQKVLGAHWRTLHLLSLPTLMAIGLHCLLTSDRYLGQLSLTFTNYAWTVGLALVIASVFLIRARWIWRCFNLEKYYVPPSNSAGSQS
ncbi:MAG: sulfite exporter TauE/SafE family protein [Cyanobacteria bacterium P01_H01_bin.15]